MSICRLCLGENNQGSVAEGIENKEQWEGPEFQGTASSGQEKEAKVFTFYRMEEEGKRENLISNEFAVKLCLEHEEKNGENIVKRELLVSLNGEFYFMKFIVNPEEEDVEPSVIFGRSFMRLPKGITDFGKGIITIYPELDPFLDNSKKTKKFEDDWDYLLDIDFGGIPGIDEANLPPFKEAAQEALAIDICKTFFILKKERPVIETMAYSDKYKKILDGIVMDKLKLDGEIKKEEEEAIEQVKGEALKEKEDPGAFIIPIRLEAKSDLNSLADAGSDINVTPYQIYAKLDMLIDKDALKLVGRGFLYTCGSILNTRDRITSTFDGVYHQTFHAAKTSLNTEESDSDD
nr:hypothetical protein [Tanacetum cinerariifolium]